MSATNKLPAFSLNEYVAAGLPPVAEEWLFTVIHPDSLKNSRRSPTAVRPKPDRRASSDLVECGFLTIHCKSAPAPKDRRPPRRTPSSSTVRSSLLLELIFKER